jgi:hypothetical protein
LLWIVAASVAGNTALLASSSIRSADAIAAVGVRLAVAAVVVVVVVVVVIVVVVVVAACCAFLCTECREEG